eukprot:15446995-Alexandrium_andersonii.AAC.2
MCSASLATFPNILTSPAKLLTHLQAHSFARCHLASPHPSESKHDVWGASPLAQALWCLASARVVEVRGWANCLCVAIGYDAVAGNDAGNQPAPHCRRAFSRNDARVAHAAGEEVAAGSTRKVGVEKPALAR